MADTVRYLMEEMIPELEDMERRGYFNKEEIKQIVKKRTDFEYALKRRSPIKMDYLRYIEYESKLDSLRKHRRRILGLEGQKRTLADYAMTRRIHFIYERATRKFRGDLGMWMAWAEFCKTTKSAKQMSRVLTKALQLHPTEAGLWSYAAVWEFEGNQNPHAARTLMLRAIRMNPASHALWVEYFKFELLYAHRLRARRAVLGIDDAALEKARKQKAAGGEGGERFGDESDEAAQQILSGIVALVVFKNACKAIPDSVSLRRLFLTALHDFDLPAVPSIRDHIYDSITRDFGDHEEGWDLRARRHVPPPSTTDDDQTSTSRPDYPQALKVYNEALKAVPASKLPRMGELYVAFLLESLRALTSGAGKKEKGAKAAAQALEKQLAAVVKQLHKSGACSEGIWTAWAEYQAEAGHADEARATLREATGALPASAALWTRRISLEVASREVTDVALMSTFQACLEQATLPQGAACWPVMVQALDVTGQDKSDDSESDEDAAPTRRNDMLFAQLLARIEAKFLQAGPQAAQGSPVSEAMAEVLTVVMEKQGADAARQLGRRLTSACAAPGVPVIQALAKLEFSQLEDKKAASLPLDLRPARSVIEHGLSAYGATEPVLWLMLTGLEKEFGESLGADVGKVVWRARKTLGPAALDQFEAALRQTERK